jgi:hypothetical protein
MCVCQVRRRSRWSPRYLTWRQVCQPYALAALYSPETVFLCFWYSFLLEAEWNPGSSAVGRIRYSEKFHRILSWTRDLLACSIRYRACYHYAAAYPMSMWCFVYYMQGEGLRLTISACYPRQIVVNVGLDTSFDSTQGCEGIWEIAREVNCTILRDKW